MDFTHNRIGLIAGSGAVPIYFARKASQLGMKIVSVGFSEEIQNGLAPFSEKSYFIGVGQAGKILETFQQNDIKDLLILGKVEKSIIFKLQKFDLKALKFLKNIVTNEDKVLLLGMIGELEKEGFKVLSQKEFLADIFPAKGNLTLRAPNKKELADIEFGLPIARKLADHMDFYFLEIKPSDLASIYVHGGQKLIGEMFDEAEENAPSILFVDELDALTPRREGDSVGHHYKAEVNEFLVQLNECSKKGILVVGATNFVSNIDQAVQRPGRLDKKIFIGPPDFESRNDLFHDHAHPKEKLLKPSSCHHEYDINQYDFLKQDF